MLVSVQLTQSGTSVAWSFDYMKPGDAAGTNIASGTVTSSTVGGVIEFDANVGGTEITGVGLGEVTIQYAVTPLNSGHRRRARRLQRGTGRDPAVPAVHRSEHRVRAHRKRGGHSADGCPDRRADRPAAAGMRGR